MTKFSASPFIFITLILFFSCGSGEVTNTDTHTPEKPKALQDDKLSTASYRRSESDLVEDLYQELVEKTPDLKKLEEDLKAFKPKQDNLTETFNNYNGKSTSYYATASSKAPYITDSLLRERIQNFISSSQKKYSKSTTELNALTQILAQNNIAINDHHTALKIILTLPLIETYQKENIPGNAEFNALIKEQKTLILQTDRATPTF